MAWRLLDFQHTNIFENMAIDETVFFETVRNGGKPTIRFYASRPAAVTIGFFQDVRKELNLEKCRERHMDVVRRITGGQAVFHIGEITYSVSASGEERIFPPDVSGAHQVISRCLSRGLSRLGIRAMLAEKGRQVRNGERNANCFASPSRNELLVGGRKICGSAQVRTRGGFLQHGLMFLDFHAEETIELIMPAAVPAELETLKRSVTSVNQELGRSVSESEIISALKQGFMDELGIALQPEGLTTAEIQRKDELIKKYRNIRWNMDRKDDFKAVE